MLTAKFATEVVAMSARIEVLHNGERACVSGINGDGVLSVIVTYVKRASEQPTYELSVSGLGQYHPAHKQSQHVLWPTPEVQVGDEIAIRILPAGSFEPPKGMIPSPSKSLDDSVFGQLQYQIEVWVGETAFEHGPFKSALLNIVAPDTGPTESQRRLFQEFAERHDVLWPMIAEALVRCHKQISSTNELLTKIRSRFDVIMDEDLNSLSVRYSIIGEPKHRAYVIKLRDWELAEIYPIE